jgi:hypothetical protein
MSTTVERMVTSKQTGAGEEKSISMDYDVIDEVYQFNLPTSAI